MKTNLSPFFFLMIVAFFSGLLFSGCEKEEEYIDGQSIGDVYDADSNVYHTIVIGEQVWMVENLNTNKYRNGDPLPQITDPNEWGNIEFGAYRVWENLSVNNEAYGKYYNWFAVDDKRNLAPKGWHVATSEDWKTLLDYVSDTYLVNEGSSSSGGGGQIVSNRTGEMVARFLASAGIWEKSDISGAPGNDYSQNNGSGFNAMPGGFIDTDGIGKGLLQDASFWSSNDYSDIDIYNEDGTLAEKDLTIAICYKIGCNSKNVYSFGLSKKTGCTVRCVKD